jgi:CRISPR/Cas system CMR-associated protein Cmr5 small subunit
MTKTPKDLVPFTFNEQRKLLSLAHGAALDTLFQAQETIAWHESKPGRLSRHSLLRGNKSAWMEREERAARELARAKETLVEYAALVEKIEAVFEVAETAEVEAFAASMAQRYREATAGDKKRKP